MTGACTPRAKLAFDALGRSHELVVGMDWEQWDYDTAAPGRRRHAPFSRRAGEQTNQAVYAQANLWLAERTRLVLGARSQRTEERLEEEVSRSTSAAQRTTWRPMRRRCARASAAAGPATASIGSSFRARQLRRQRLLLPALRGDPAPAADRAPAESGRRVRARRLARACALYHIADLENEIYFSPLRRSPTSTCRRRGAAASSWRRPGARRPRSSCALRSR